MQFYEIHEDPWISAKSNPDYAIREVNVREGYQILSDCGHALGYSWSTQNKEYKRYHPNTWRYWKNSKAFYNFIDHYIACLSEARDRGFDKLYTTYQAKFKVFMLEVFPYMKIPDHTDQQNIIFYLLNRKIHKITPEEEQRLWELAERTSL